jgi:hypothetical protein
MVSETKPQMTRREVGRLLLSVPAATLIIAEARADEGPSETAEFLAAHEPGLSPDERERLRKGFADEEKALRVVREFTLAPDVTPSLRFHALASGK